MILPLTKYVSVIWLQACSDLIDVDAASVWRHVPHELLGGHLALERVVHVVGRDVAF